AAIPAGWLVAGSGNSVTTPAVVILPIRSPDSTNHRLPSGPRVMSLGALPALMPAENSVTVPVTAEAGGAAAARRTAHSEIRVAVAGNLRCVRDQRCIAF